MPDASEKELGAATERLMRYFAVLLRIHERTKAELEEHDSPEFPGHGTIRSRKSI